MEKRKNGGKNGGEDGGKDGGEDGGEEEGEDGGEDGGENGGKNGGDTCPSRDVCITPPDNSITANGNFGITDGALAMKE